MSWGSSSPVPSPLRRRASSASRRSRDGAIQSRSNAAYASTTSRRTASGSRASRIALPCENTST